MGSDRQEMSKYFERERERGIEMIRASKML
jgi:hypothetical protein